MQKLGLDYEVLASGCCGMAGSFGFERDKYGISVEIGERKLLPAVRRAPLSTVIMADGFSCREQIAQETGRHALHLAEVIQMGLHRERESSGPEVYPEKALVMRRKSSRRKARWRAMGALAAVGVGAAFAWNLLRNR